MAYNNNNNNRLNNYQLPMNFQPIILSQNNSSSAGASSNNNEQQLLTPRSVLQKFFLTNANQHLPDRFDYQTYFNVHGLCGRRSVSPVYYNSNQTAINLQTQNYQNCYNIKPQTINQHPYNNSNNTSNYSSSSNTYNNNHPQIHYGISNTYSLVEPSTPNALKIPTTPTRSKSLSPSLRTVVQPPRIRHKQNAVNANISLAASTTSVSVNNQKYQPVVECLPKMTNNPPTTSSSNHQKQIKNQVQIQKPIPIIATKLQPIKTTTTATKIEDDEKIKKPSLPKESTEKKSEIAADIVREKIVKMIKFQLPINARMINYSNFPNYKKSSNKLKNPEIQSQEYCLNLLRKTLQVSVNEKIKQLFDDYKNDYIQPMIDNFRKNYGNSNETSEDEDAFHVCIQLLDEAKEMFTNEMENLKLKSERSVTNNVSTKRKSLYEAYCEKLSAKSLDVDEQQNNKKQKLNETTKDVAITTNTKFVLGQNANKLYLLTSAVENDLVFHKSIYTKYPALFKYELDHFDKQWLFDNLIIRRKMVKMYIFIFADLLVVFKTATFDKKKEIESISSGSDEDGVDDEEEATRVSDNVYDENDKNRIEFIKKHLIPFQLPQLIINKIKKQYLSFQKKDY